MSPSAGNQQTNPKQPLAERMTEPTNGTIQPVQITEKEKKIVAENDHHGTGSKLAEKISNALDFPGINSKPPPAQTRKGL